MKSKFIRGRDHREILDIGTMSRIKELCSDYYQNEKYDYLPICASKGLKAYVEFLLNSDDKEILSGKDWALFMAAKAGEEDIVKILLDAGADPESNEFDSDLLSISAWSGYTEIVEYLLETGLDLEVDNALYGAAEEGHRDVVEVLLRYEPSRTAIMDSRDRALELGHRDIAEILEGELSDDVLEESLFIRGNPKKSMEIGLEKIMREEAKDLNSKIRLPGISPQTQKITDFLYKWGPRILELDDWPDDLIEEEDDYYGEMPLKEKYYNKIALWLGDHSNLDRWDIDNLAWPVLLAKKINIITQNKYNQ